MRFWVLLIWALVAPLLYGQEIERISLPLIDGMQRADLYELKPTESVVGVLVLCPGFNEKGDGFLRDPAWQEFARQHHLGLVGLSFASEKALLRNGEGYYYASKGSGQILLDGIQQMFGGTPPLLLFGFSGGAHFTSRFAEWKPERVLAWCAYSAGWWDLPKPSIAMPPGIIACGDQDPRYGASLMYFKQGRALDKPWLWISVPTTGHSISSSVEVFVREYFDALLGQYPNIDPHASGLWIDIDQGVPTDPSQQPTAITGWLPAPALLEPWRKICVP